MLSGGERNLKLVVDIILKLLKDFLFHLIAVFVYQLDAIIGKGIVRSGNHNATIKGPVNNLIAHTRRWDNVQDICVCSGGNKARDQCGFKHITGTARILSQNHAGTSSLAESVIPANETADLIRMVNIEPLVCAPSKAIGTKILHSSSLLYFMSRHRAVYDTAIPACSSRFLPRA